ncbi:hypothetical protein [Streptomyces marispadix]|uniref:Uncharacterized protein n=1 Tax=Streptomyces marispadix TaxID=2922868 RepID=A0ABS9T154_9ACTN|nr:hypothetical protein [Streptomyces marispadix]MCH6162021.1 hypothetical protein [Streptomyces marispadix]
MTGTEDCARGEGPVVLVAELEHGYAATCTGCDMPWWFSATDFDLDRDIKPWARAHANICSSPA